MADRFITQFSSLLEYTKGLEKITGQSAFVVPTAEDYLNELRGASMSTTETKVCDYICRCGQWYTEVATMNETREQKAQRLVRESDRVVHTSDCSTSIAPAEEPQACDCGIRWAAQHTAGHDTHGQTAIYDETTGKDVAIVYDGDAHAKFIIRAVNSHADMLEALEHLTMLLRDIRNLYPSNPAGEWLTKSKCYTAALQAIQKAKGGAA